MTDRVQSSKSWLVRALFALVLPVLLAAPIVFVLQRQASAQGEAERDLDEALVRARGQIASLANLNRVRAELLARKAVVEAVDESRPDIGALFNVLGALPDGVRVDSIRMAGAEVYLEGTSARGDAEVATLLEASGLVVEKRDSVEPGHFGLLADVRGLKPTESSQ